MFPGNRNKGQLIEKIMTLKSHYTSTEENNDN